MKISLIWNKYWKLTITNQYRKDRTEFCVCICDCWNIKHFRTTKVIHLNNKSCGCLIKTRAITHWLTKTPLFNKFYSIKTRCTNKKFHAYKDYWWRWIKCERKTLKEFKDDMYESYIEHCKEYGEKDTTIDRYPNKDWNYCKENCRRATRKEQNENQRTNVILEHNWEKKTISQWARELWINYDHLRYITTRRWIYTF